jgi:hypothetical protein
MNLPASVTHRSVPALVAAGRARFGALPRILRGQHPHTRRAYARAAEEFLAWCASLGVPSIAAVQPGHVAAWIEALTS